MRKVMDISKEIQVICESLNLTETELQYVLKTNKAVANATFIQEMYVCKKEKENCYQNRNSLTNDGIQKVKLAKIAYKIKGNYFEEILK